MAPSVPDLTAAALKDAGIAEREVAIYWLDRAGTADDYRAMAWKAGIEIDNPQHVDYLGDYADQANGPDLELPRIAVCTVANDIVDAALLRHELEHIVQFKMDPKLAELHERAVKELTTFLDRVGGGRFYNFMPMEFEANYVASRFVRKHFPRELVDQAASDPRNEALLWVYDENIMTARMRQFIRFDVRTIAAKVHDHLDRDV